MLALLIPGLRMGGGPIVSGGATGVFKWSRSNAVAFAWTPSSTGAFPWSI